MSMYSLLQNNPSPTAHTIEHSFDGNLCRCTGYRPILDAAKTFACDKHTCQPPLPAAGGPATPGLAVSDTAQKLIESVEADAASLSVADSAMAYLRTEAPGAPLLVQGLRATWHTPRSLEALLAIKAATPTAKLVVGNTEVGIEAKFKHAVYPVQVRREGPLSGCRRGRRRRRCCCNCSWCRRVGRTVLPTALALAASATAA